MRKSCAQCPPVLQSTCQHRALIIIEKNTSTGTQARVSLGATLTPDGNTSECHLTQESELTSFIYKILFSDQVSTLLKACGLNQIARAPTKETVLVW